MREIGEDGFRAAIADADMLSSLIEACLRAVEIGIAVRVWMMTAHGWKMASEGLTVKMR